MQFKQGAHVYSSDNQDVGTIDRVVLNPSNNEVSDLVVRKGWLFSEDKVVPISWVNSATDDKVTLSKSKDSLTNLQTFEETYYVPATDEDYHNGTLVYPDPVYTYPPVGIGWWGYTSYPLVDANAPDYAERVQQNIPTGTVALKEGAHVLGVNGNRVGDIEEVITESATNRVTHVVISKGVFFKERRLIPSNWLKEVDSEEVMLTVSNTTVNALPAYQDPVHS